MELKNAIDLFKNNIFFLIIFIILGTVIGYQSAQFLPSGYSQSQLFFAVKPQTNQQSDSYEGYYSQENARNFTDTAAAILEDPQLLKQSLKNSQTVTIRKIAPQVIRITIQSQKKEDLAGSIDQIARSFNLKVADLTQSEPPISLKPVSQASEISFFALNPLILSLFGATLAIIAALLIIFLKIYFKV